ncbi:hypothetical protein AQUCO_03500023v1 [Aquilegia coerulea]|uniref:Root cap n=1 Tax=Aquilegia coerulea TaxID=218851 RepID=A0A2G5CVP1_AQUCA|nr:hypothetical protein AQUCO_03500023v1 [Aquilegia coerulea]
MNTLTNSHNSMLILLFLLITSSFAHIHADPYDTPIPPAKGSNPAAPPPSEVAGKEFPPQSFLCNDPLTKCYGKNITCPSQCPVFKPTNATAKGCFIDCMSTKCEAICKNRKPNCDGIGSACYDPRFVGGDGVMFYFHGKTNEHFSLVSDLNLQINARFIGRRPEGRSRDNTWIQALGIMFGSHTFTLAANKVAQWDDQVDQLLFTYDDMPVFIKEGLLSTWSAPDSDLAMERTTTFNGVTMTLPGVVEISVNVVPITKEDDQIHHYQIPSDNCFAHLEVQFKFLDLSENVEGVLGQTYRPDFQSPVKRGVPMPIMGGEDKYKTSSLLSSNCKYCIYSSEFSDDAKYLMLDHSTKTVDCSSKMSNGRGVMCRR